MARKSSNAISQCLLRSLSLPKAKELKTLLVSSTSEVRLICNHSLGKDLHFTILMYAKEILKIVKTIATTVDLHGLEKIEDSV